MALCTALVRHNPVPQGMWGGCLWELAMSRPVPYSCSLSGPAPTPASHGGCPGVAVPACPCSSQCSPAMTAAAVPGTVLEDAGSCNPVLYHLGPCSSLQPLGLTVIAQNCPAPWGQW